MLFVFLSISTHSININYFNFCVAALGALARINYGLKGFAVAGTLGGILGLIAGGLIITTLGVNGITMDEFRLRLHEERYLRLKYVKNLLTFYQYFSPHSYINLICFFYVKIEVIIHFCSFLLF